MSRACRMETLYWLEPSVDGVLGEQTQISDGQITCLEYEFTFWSGDELICEADCFIMTETLYHELEQKGMTGLSKAPLAVSVSAQRLELYGPLDLPRFVWLKPTGRVMAFSRTFRLERDVQTQFGWTGDDFCLDPRGRLLITSCALNAIGLERIRHATIKPVIVLVGN